MIADFNAFVTRAIDLAMRPAAGMPPLASLAVVSLLSAVAVLLVAKATSNQGAIAAAKRNIQADLFEVRLFNDDLAGTFRALGAMLAHAFAYFRLSLVPALWLFVPFTVVLIHLDAFYGYTGIPRGETTLVTAEFDPSASAPPVTLQASSGVRIDTPALWFPAAHEMIWRVTALDAGPFELRLQAGSVPVVKTLQVSTRLVRRSPVRSSAGLFEVLTNPSEPPLPPGPIHEVTVAYPAADVDVLGRPISWLVVYLALTLAFAVMLRRPMRVEM